MSRPLVVRPPRLAPPSRIAVISPSSSAAYRFPGRARRACGRLAATLGVEVLPPDHAIPSGYRAFRPEEAAARIHACFADPGIGLAIAAVGGFNTNAVLAHLDWDLMRRHPTHLCGYSDATALLLAVHARTGQVVLHGPALMPQWGDPTGPFPQSVESLRHGLGMRGDDNHALRDAGFWVDPRTDWSDIEPERSFRDKPLIHAPWRTLRPGIATGHLLGGNIETLNMLAGTAWMPDFSGAIVFLEATGAEAYLPRLHRALVHLRDNGVFEAAAGVVFGRVPDCAPVDGIGLDDVLLEVLQQTDIPIAVDVDIGHTEPMLTLPIGAAASLVAGPDGPHLVLSGYG